MLFRPVVAFKTGGVPEMIDHLKNGYLAEAKNASDLANGMFQVLFEVSGMKYGENAREKALSSYSEEVVVADYLKVYNDALSK